MEKTYNFKLTEKEVNLVLAALVNSASDYSKAYNTDINDFDRTWHSIYKQAGRKKDLEV